MGCKFGLSVLLLSGGSQNFQPQHPYKKKKKKRSEYPPQQIMAHQIRSTAVSASLFFTEATHVHRGAVLLLLSRDTIHNNKVSHIPPWSGTFNESPTDMQCACVYVMKSARFI